MNRIARDQLDIGEQCLLGRPCEPTHMRRATMNQTKAMAPKGNR